MIINTAYLFKNIKITTDLKVSHIVYKLKKLIRLHLVVMMIEDCKLSMKLHHILMVQVSEKYIKQSY